MLPEAVSSDELATTVAALQRPLVFLDTAAILDISRVPYRQELQVGIMESAAAMIDDLLANPRRISVVTTANVIREFQAHRESVQQELEARISDLSQSISRLSRVARIVFPERRISHLEWLELTLQQRVLGIMDRLVTSMIVFRGTSGCIGKARDRLWAGLPPASKAKQEFKDCEIFEEFLELVVALRSRGFDQPAIFVTPNSRDYGPPPRGHDQVASDLEPGGALYAANVAWAYALARGMAR